MERKTRNLRRAKQIVLLIVLVEVMALVAFSYLNKRRERPSPNWTVENFPPESSPSPQDPASTAARTADMVFVEKGARRLTLFSKGKRVRTYMVALGFEPVGKKSREGDGRTPEGRYIIDRRTADSGFHRALHISYPNAEDKRRAAALGVSPGGDIMIHGLKNGTGWIGGSHRLLDWTLGCIAVTNDEIEEIWRMAPDGTAVEIVP